MPNVQIIFYSMYGHIYKMAEAVAEGARKVAGANVEVFQVPETLPAEVIAKMGATEAKKAFAHVPTATVAHLADADAIIFGIPTRYGLPIAQIQAFMDATGGLWATGKLIGKVGSIFSSTASQHGGQESTPFHAASFFYHQGMVIVGCPYAAKEMLTLSEVTGGTPYGATTIAGDHGQRQPTENELAIARFQGEHVTKIAAKLAGK